MGTRSYKRRISGLMRSRVDAYFWRLDAGAVGREFASLDYERLQQLDGFAFDTFGEMDLVNAWVRKPHPLLGGLTPEACVCSDAGLEQVLNLLAVIKRRKSRPDSQFVRDAVTRMHTMKPHFLTDEMWDIMEDYDGPIVSGDPDGWVPDDLENDDNEEDGYGCE